MDRLAYKSLITWKSSAYRKPLVVQGARQVGKTFLLRQFGLQEYADYAYFNFEESPKLRTLFENDLAPAELTETLGAWRGKTILPQATLVFFDEIQSCPKALTSLKYFCEQAPQFHIVAAGSLLGVSVGKSSSFPVGKVNFLTMYPLTFMEFLKSAGEEILYNVLIEKKDLVPLQDILHEKLIGLLKTFFFIGGMPEAVERFNQTHDVSAVREVQKEIIRAFERDFSKYTTPTEAVRISEIWRSIPAHLARENKKFKYGDIRKNGRASQFESAIEWLRSAGLVYQSLNITAPKLPLAGYEDHGRFKVYLLDTGLLGAMVDLPSKTIVDGNTLFSEYNGAFVENFAATQIAAKTGSALHYWISEGTAEVDFIIPHEDRIYPLEIKSGNSRSVKSLRVYAERFSPPKIIRSSPRNFEAQGDFCNVPLYGVGLVPEIAA